MPIEFIGANPNVTLFRGQAKAGFVSLWEAEWSVRGPGVAVLAWVEGDTSVRLLTPEFALGAWLADTFSRHFPELADLPEVGEPVECEIREWRITNEHVRARVTGEDGSRVGVTIAQPFASRPVVVTDWQLGDSLWTLTNLLTFCTDATLEIDDARVLGRAVVSEDGEKPTSTAFIATHETWTRH
ncbi:hypothetical protein EF847_01965 [Actinobacteria bacterium YIM 96077]|uniref:Uncharacterized protein n=1 Tax=Phytoactinopolyspora halophila TaxID=1981511 RepID=A0A329R0K8_9ACTN|nr:hypothetical protein [Phytoactinopolyspora halophila]AYY11674.1 hypothetical protein EF847_01965 [Actinobacteria bacterium YIM 96077]RAW17893.1 hypothetical protein DPM12_03315 [Phytoactinopolyspora halophila]